MSLLQLLPLSSLSHCDVRGSLIYSQTAGGWRVRVWCARRFIYTVRCVAAADSSTLPLVLFFLRAYMRGGKYIYRATESLYADSASAKREYRCRSFESLRRYFVCATEFKVCFILYLILFIRG